MAVGERADPSPRGPRARLRGRPLPLGEHKERAMVGDKEGTEFEAKRVKDEKKDEKKDK